ncbi:MAG: cache domain-containing protein, partial [Deltaproteobacteria bacterium]|nr:cache domain-containing protein [Deltaproteobacteria bacterium]
MIISRVKENGAARLIVGFLAATLLAATGIAAETPASSGPLNRAQNASKGTASNTKIPRTGILNARRVNIRQGPGLNERIVGMVFREGTKLEVVAQEGDWIEVNSERGSAWIHGRYLDMAEEKSATGKQAPASQTSGEQIAQQSENSQTDLAKTDNRTENEAPDAAQKSGFGYKQALEKVMDLVFVYLDSLDKRNDIGRLEKKQKAIEFIKNVMWGPDNKYYFWINDLDGVMIMEPLYPQTEGTNAIKYKDLNNREIFVEFISKSLNKEQAFINHNSLGYDTNWSPWVSLVSLFEAWDWIVGTYVELEDID